NRARVRQAGTVERATVGLRLVDGGRQARIACTLGESAAMQAVLTGGLADLRAAVAQLPVDPHACWQPVPGSSERIDGAGVPAPDAAIAAIVASAEGDVLAGLYAAGPVVRELASSLGHRHYHETVSSTFDFSVQVGGDRAVKAT